MSDNSIVNVRRRGAPTRFVLACASVAVLATTSGCIYPVAARGPRFGMDTLSIRRPPRDHGRIPETFSVSEKRVGGKEEPATLIAEDGSRCTVTKRRFRTTQVGQFAVCAWRRDDRGT
jgi:hypothetical protein